MISLAKPITNPPGRCDRCKHVYPSLQPAGNLLDLNPHLHCLVTAGAFDAATGSTFYRLPKRFWRCKGISRTREGSPCGYISGRGKRCPGTYTVTERLMTEEERQEHAQSKKQYP